MLTVFERHLLFATNILICDHKRWSSSRVNELLHFEMALLTSTLENTGQEEWKYEESSVRIEVLTQWC